MPALGKSTFKSIPSLSDEDVRKSILNGMNGIVYRDDVQVVALRARKEWCPDDEQPRVDVKIEWGD